MIAVAGGKGGSGKTTTTLGLARAVARRGRSDVVVAADADWDLPNLARLASATGDGPDRERAPTVIDAVRSEPSTDPKRAGPSTDPKRADSSAHVNHAGDSLAPLDTAPTVLAAPDDPEAHDACEVLSTLACRLDSAARTVLVDCPAGASPDAAAPLRAADHTVLVTPLRPAALRDTVKTAEMARALDCPPLGVVATRTGSAPGRLSELLGCPVLGSIPESTPAPLSDRAVRSAYDEVAHALSSVSGTERSTYRQSQRRTDNR